MKTMGRPPKARKTALGKRLLAIRERLALTQAQAAEKLGITEDAWFSWESGRNKPTASHLILIQFLEDGKL